VPEFIIIIINIIIIFHFLPGCHNFCLICLAEVKILMIYFALCIVFRGKYLSSAYLQAT